MVYVWLREAMAKIYITRLVFRSRPATSTSCFNWHISLSTLISMLMSECSEYFAKNALMPNSKSRWVQLDGIQTAQLMCENRGVLWPHYAENKERTCSLLFAIKIVKCHEHHQNYSWRIREIELASINPSWCRSESAAEGMQCNIFLETFGCRQQRWDIDRNLHIDSGFRWISHLEF